jgi:hypothetical protein
MNSSFAGFLGCFVRRIGGIGGMAVGAALGLRALRQALSVSGWLLLIGRALFLGLVRVIFGS